MAAIPTDGYASALQMHASFHAQERSVTMAWQQFMEHGHLRTCLADLTTILQACCVQTNQLMLTRNPVRVEGRSLGCSVQTHKSAAPHAAS